MKDTCEWNGVKKTGLALWQHFCREKKKHSSGGGDLSALFDEMGKRKERKKETQQGASLRKCEGGTDTEDGVGQGEDDEGREIRRLVSQAKPF